MSLNGDKRERDLNLLSEVFQLSGPTNGRHAELASCDASFLLRTVLVLVLVLTCRRSRLGADQREAQGRCVSCGLGSLTLPSSLRLARCMASAASVSDCSLGDALQFGQGDAGAQESAPQPGSSRNSSKGVAQRR